MLSEPAEREAQQFNVLSRYERDPLATCNLH